MNTTSVGTSVNWRNWIPHLGLLHLSIASSQAKGKIGKNTKVLQGKKGCRLKHKFRQQWTIVSLLSILTSSSMYPMGSLYISSMGQWRVEFGRYQGIWKAKRQVSQIHVKENSKRICPFAHIPMYAVLRVISAYIHENRFKSNYGK